MFYKLCILSPSTADGTFKLVAFNPGKIFHLLGKTCSTGDTRLDCGKFLIWAHECDSRGCCYENSDVYPDCYKTQEMIGKQLNLNSEHILSTSLGGGLFVPYLQTISINNT